jgi:hypothetical protein
VRPQEPLIVLPDTSVMIAAVKVHESLAGRVEEGQPATVKIDAIGGRVFTGVVESIGVMAESQGRWMDPNRREYTVKIALQNVGDGVRLKPAMRCEATITLGRVENVVAVPLQAVFTDEMVRFVYVPRDGRYARVPVKIGRRSDTLAEIAAGLSPRERVLVREPSPGEVLREAWDAAALKLVGLEIGEDGKPLPIGGGQPSEPDRPIVAGQDGPGRGGPGPGGRGGRAREGAQANRPGRQGGNRPAAARPPESKPAETKPAETTGETTTTTTDTKS